MPAFRLASLGALCTALALVPSLSAAAAPDAFPERAIRIVVPYAPGGTNDVVARLVSQKLSDQLKQPVVVENKPGASGNIGAEQVSRAPADGYTLVLVTTGHTIHPSIYTNLRYDITKDLVPVARLSSGPMLVMVNPKLPVNTVGDLVALAKSKPNALNFASAGNGSSTHLAMELLSNQAGIRMNHIPYGGSAPAMADVMAGNADLVMDLMFSALPQVQSGRLRAIGITSAKRSALLPDLPTVSESGVEGFDAEAWNGLMAPAKTPQSVIDRLTAEIRKALADPELKARLDAQGFSGNWASPADFGAVIGKETARWAGVVKRAGIKLD